MPRMSPSATAGSIAARARPRGEADRIGTSIEPPRDGAPGEHGLAPEALRYANILTSLSLGAVAVGGAAAVLLLVQDTGWRLAALIAMVVLLAAGAALDLLVLNPIQVRSSSYTATSDFVYIARGRWVRRTVLIATSQILNVETAQGPILRALDVVKVRLTCIADVEAIVPLTPAAAEALRAVVMDAQRVDDA